MPIKNLKEWQGKMYTRIEGFRRGFFIEAISKAFVYVPKKATRSLERVAKIQSLLLADTY